MTDPNFHLRTLPLFVAALAGLAGLPGCGDDTPDFVDVQGTYADGTPLSLHEQFQRVTCDATKLAAPCETLKAIRLVDTSQTDIRGVRLDFIPSMVTSQTAYTSGLLQPVIVYAVRYGTDSVTNTSGFVDNSIEGGQLTFNHIAAAPGEMTAGTFSNMVLQRPDQNGEQHTLFTIAQGSFQYLQP